MKSADMTGILRDADALLVVPPFAGIERPSLGLHVLQACAREAGFDVLVLYTNLLFAHEIGEELYVRLSFGPPVELIGEKIFAECAFGAEAPAFVRQRHKRFRYLPVSGDIDELIEMTEPLRSVASEWTDKIVQAILPFDIPVAGCNNSYEQISPSVALLSRIKAHKPGTVTIVGGANCEGEMAQGILSLGQSIDYIFSGESEQTFPEFLNNVRLHKMPVGTVIKGSPCFDLDGLPTPDLSEYYDQLDKFLPDSQLRSDNGIWLTYESSRGCWWGQKHHCKFCGQNRQRMKFREKSWDRVIQELSVLTEKHHANNVQMVDNIMPHDYFKNLIPFLDKALPGLNIFYEIKSNLNFEQAVALKKAGVIIQPGIEALSTDLLKLMDKGVTAGQNIALLRFARSVSLTVVWNLVHGLPGDSDYQYESTLRLLPLLCHLPPPLFIWPVIINRFSPYFTQPHVYEIENLRPTQAYNYVFPGHADMKRLAYNFEGDYHSATQNNPELLRSLEEKVSEWRAKWEDNDIPPPKLVITPLLKDTFMLKDTRGLGTKQVQFISRNKALAALFGTRNEKTDDIDWALENFLCVELDSQYVPLATASYEVYTELRKIRNADVREVEK